MTYSYLERWSTIFQVYINFTSHLIWTYDSKTTFAWFTDTSIDIQIE